MTKIYLQKYCNILRDIISNGPTGYILFSKSVLYGSLSSLPIKKKDMLVEYNKHFGFCKMKFLYVMFWMCILDIPK